MVLLEVFTKTWENILGLELYGKEGIQIPHLSEQCCMLPYKSSSLPYVV